MIQGPKHLKLSIRRQVRPARLLARQTAPQSPMSFPLFVCLRTGGRTRFVCATVLERSAAPCRLLCLCLLTFCVYVHHSVIWDSTSQAESNCSIANTSLRLVSIRPKHKNKNEKVLAEKEVFKYRKLSLRLQSLRIIASLMASRKKIPPVGLALAACAHQSLKIQF